MRKTAYGISIETLTAEMAEQVRLWRNLPFVRKQMEYKEFISPEMQQAWFASVQNEQYAYFLIYVGKIPAGLIHLAAINKETRTAEAGLFIGEEAFYGTGVALGASLMLLDFAFYELNLKAVYAKVKDGNLPAENYNALLGFEKIEPVNEQFNRWRLLKSIYTQNKTRLEMLIAY